jgi:hypothetical protein
VLNNGGCLCYVPCSEFQKLMKPCLVHCFPPDTAGS